MKIRSRICLLLCLFISACLLFSGCATSGTTASGGLPIWYSNPQVRAGTDQIAFTSIAQGSDRRVAELLAYSDLIDVLEDYTGLVFSQEEYRELSTTQKISKYELSIVDEFTTANEEGMVTVCFLALADKRIVEGSVSEQKAKDKELKSQIEKLVLAGDKAIKESYSLDGVKYYLQSLALSYNLDGVSQEYCYEEISSYVIEVLSDITITQNENSLYVKINETVFPTRVSDCQLRGSFESPDSNGNIKTQNKTFETDENGYLSFSNVFSATEKKVTAVFTLDIWDEIDALQEAGCPLAEQCQQLIMSKALTVEHSATYSMGKIAVAGLEYKSGGVFYDGICWTEKLCLMLEENGAETFALYCNEDLSDEQLIFSLKSNPDSAQCLLVVRVGLLDSLETENSKIAVCEGSGIFYDLKSESVLLDTSVLQTTGFGNTLEEAVENADQTLCEIIYSLLRTVYV